MQDNDFLLIFFLEHAHREREREMKKERQAKARQTDDRRGQQQGKLEMEAKKSKNVATNTESHGRQPVVQGCMASRKTARTKSYRNNRLQLQ